MRSTATTAILFFATAAFAGDAAELDFIGFSDDWSCFAYAESGIQDGSGFPYCSVRAIDATSGEVLGRADVVIDYCEHDGPSADASRRAMRQAMPFLFELGIKPGRTGFHAISHPLSDLGACPDTVRFYGMNLPAPWMPGLEAFLQTETVEDPDMLLEWGFQPVTVSVVLRDAEYLIPVQLALEDIPEGMDRYTMDYRIGDVFIGENGLVVVMLQMFRLGFEGPDVRYLAACGFPPEPDEVESRGGQSSLCSKRPNISYLNTSYIYR